MTLMRQAFAQANGSAGMDMLDYFAGQALSGICAQFEPTDSKQRAAMAYQAYLIGWAMIEQRRKLDEKAKESGS